MLRDREGPSLYKRSSWSPNPCVMWGPGKLSKISGLPRSRPQTPALPRGCSQEGGGKVSKRPLCRCLHKPPPKDRTSARRQRTGSQRGFRESLPILQGRDRQQSLVPNWETFRGSCRPGPAPPPRCLQRYPVRNLRRRARPRAFGWAGAPPSAPCDRCILQPTGAPPDPGSKHRFKAGRAALASKPASQEAALPGRV